MPAWSADRLDFNVHRDRMQGSLLATVPGRHLDLVVLLTVIAQFLCVPDVTWWEKKNAIRKWHFLSLCLSNIHPHRGFGLSASIEGHEEQWAHLKGVQVCLAVP